MPITVCSSVRVVCVVAFFSKWRIFPFCDYRTPTPLSVLILTLSGRYSNECSPLDPSVNSTWATNTQYLCFPLSPSWILPGLECSTIMYSSSCFSGFEAQLFLHVLLLYWLLFLILPSVFSLGFALFFFLWVMFFSLCALEQKQIAISY